VDLSLARREAHGSPGFHGISGTPGFIPPELLNLQTYSYSGDMFSAGALIYFMYQFILNLQIGSVEFLPSLERRLKKH
jgi:serine/threonine protein kinase